MPAEKIADAKRDGSGKENVMVSRRNFATITIMLVILLFMFQFTGVMKDKLSKYGINEYQESARTELTEKDMFPASGQSEQKTARVFYAGQSEKTKNTVKWWCTYSKRDFQTADSLNVIMDDEDNLPDVLVLDGTYLENRENINAVSDAVENGVNVVVSGLPDADEIEKNNSLRKLLGIRYVEQKEVTLEGIHLFAGFLLGGEVIYQAKDEEEEKNKDMDLTVPWYVTGEGTKSYMVGMLEDVRPDSGRQPAIIWRNGLENACVFCVNGDYLEDNSGIGILDAMMAEASSFEIYPVVNAQNLVIANYPGFASENENNMEKIYSQSQKALFREIIWPSLVSIERKIDAKLTCMMTPQFDYNDENEPREGEVAYYLKLLKEEYGEAGLSSGNVSDTGLSEKMEQDEQFWKREAPDYGFQSLFLENENELGDALENDKLGGIRTVVTPESQTYDEPVISFAKENVTLQRATGDGVNHTFMDDFRQRCIQTALGYSNTVWDLLVAAYPEKKADAWEVLSKEAASNICTYQKPYMVFDETTLSKSDQRIRRFFALSYSVESEDNTISLHVDGLEEQAWFLLHTGSREIEEMHGGSFSAVEDGVYLICAENDEVTIRLNEEEEKQLFFYED